ncbi:MAG TPA: Hsp20/alpha crystallin family protein [Phycisphaerae bacterium]|jgi:HSP20 family protein|nr:Hsp20/alpha crystallin family protein [Phycisphaerae bacterium]HOJ55360.1 Hsp20/alpha crystallin family protein [Phycisphaerae bacterium]HOL25113.1 Hsp20/alpha crystallin family protein [Phycisphaerae bacterium]HPP19711.1 Hsp20/alpha crystallin family protein [Phycisphaerae bacterium]HPU33763.1 Hsp20/alpha crystallin family protein [Phycisphaerae bacterium]
MANESTIMEPTGKREGAMTQPEYIRGGRVYSPGVDIIELENELLLVADVPGARPEDVEIDYEQGMLTLHARVEPRRKGEDLDWLLYEYGVGDYYRSFQIGEAIDASKIEAEFKNGVLTVHLPKTEAARPRKIQVKVSS